MSVTEEPHSHFEVSVRALAEFCCRRGDLGSGSGLAGLRAEQGQAAQRRQQAQVPAGYRKEVPVARTLVRGPLTLEIRGRIDGLWQEGDQTFIEEIKATRHSDASLPDDVHTLNHAQARLYAALWTNEQTLPAATIRVTYCHPDHDGVFVRDDTADAASLASWFDTVATGYLDWLDQVRAHRLARDRWCASVAFPWPDYRPGQRELMVHAWRTLRDGKVSLVQAPTGAGKTLSLLFPALRLLGSGGASQVMFLTAKTSGQRSAMQALAQLQADQGVLSVCPGPRERVCPCPADSAAPCSRRLGYHDRLPDARREAMHAGRLDGDGLAALTERHHLCPHQFALDMAPWADLVVGDFNYAFDPAARLDWAALPDSATVLLVDEAHNLGPRARDMHSAPLGRGRLEAMLALDPPAALRKALRALLRWMDDLPAGTTLQTDPPPALLPLLLRLIERLDTWREANPEQRPEASESLWFDLVTLRRALDAWGPHYRFVQRAGGTQCAIEAWCVDPGVYLCRDLGASRAALLFSGTLSPRRFHAHLCGVDRLPEDRRARDIALPHALRQTRLDAVILPWRMDFQTRERSLQRFPALITHWLTDRPGRWLCCAPSFAVLQTLQALLGADCAGHPCLIQHEGMGSQQQTDWIEAFRQRPRALGLVISGGRFAEGLDLADTPLTGVIMAGLPVAPPSPEGEALRDHYDRVGLDGRDLLWRQPGLERTLQSVGRLLRRDGDEGIALLVDARFADRSVRERLPAHWTLRLEVDDGAPFRA